MEFKHLFTKEKELQEQIAIVQKDYFPSIYEFIYETSKHLKNFDINKLNQSIKEPDHQMYGRGAVAPCGKVNCNGEH